MSTTALMALNQDWLQNSASTVTTGDVTPLSSSTTMMSGTSAYWYPWYEHYWYPSYSHPVYVSSPSRPIKLTLREVERLRDVAHRDHDLRTILERFTPLIEVSVTFEER